MILHKWQTSHVSYNGVYQIPSTWDSSGRAEYVSQEGWRIYWDEVWSFHDPNGELGYKFPEGQMQGLRPISERNWVYQHLHVFYTKRSQEGIFAK